MIRIDALWLATTPIDMRMGTERLLARVVGEQSRQIESQAQAIGFRDAKIASITFELRRLKARQFAARTERMNASSASCLRKRWRPTRQIWKPSSQR